MFGESGALESPSRPWHAWHIIALAAPALTLPAWPASIPASRRPAGPSNLRASNALRENAEIIQNLASTKQQLKGWPRVGPSRHQSLLAVVPDAVERTDQIVGHDQ